MQNNARVDKIEEIEEVLTKLGQDDISDLKVKQKFIRSAFDCYKLTKNHKSMA